MDWLKKAAPYLVTALTGNVPALAAMAAKDISDVLGVSDDVEEVKKALNEGSMPPEVVAKLKEQEQAFALKMRELGYRELIDLETIAAGDRASARQREIQTNDWMPKALGLIVTFGFFGILIFLLIHGVPVIGGDVLLVMLGALGSAWGAIINYYFGSSSGSDAKTKIMANKQT